MESSAAAGELPNSVLLSILRRCEDVGDIYRTACINKQWHSVVYDDSFWKELCARHLHLLLPHDSYGNVCPSFRDAYKSWHVNFCKFYPLSLVVRVKALSESLKMWASENSPELARSFRPGIMETEINEFEKDLGFKLPLSAHLLYRFFDGQETPEHIEEDFDDDDDDDEHLQLKHSIGLLGGYNFYGDSVNVYMLSLKMALLLTQDFMCYWTSLDTSRNWLVIATSIPLKKYFLLDCNDGSVHVGTRNLDSKGETMPCVPPMVDVEHSLLYWLEEYALRLKKGMYKIQKFDKLCVISLFPDCEPFCTEAVTCGVQVRGSAVFVPEYSTLQMEEERFMFTYLIRMCLLPSGPGSCYHNFDSCQLVSRHWIIRENGVVKAEVLAEAVIGLFPLLRSAGDTFKYASCSRSSAPQGSIEGDFTFVPGSMKCPEGPEFTVQVARFELEVPVYIY